MHQYPATRKCCKCMVILPQGCSVSWQGGMEIMLRHILHISAWKKKKKKKFLPPVPTCKRRQVLMIWLWSSKDSQFSQSQPLDTCLWPCRDPGMASRGLQLLQGLPRPWGLASIEGEATQQRDCVARRYSPFDASLPVLNFSGPTFQGWLSGVIGTYFSYRFSPGCNIFSTSQARCRLLNCCLYLVM